MPLHLLQLSDTHLLKDAEGRLLGCPPQHSLQAVIDRFSQSPPDLLLLTGDLVQDQAATSYERVARLVRSLKAPCYALPGNHDDPAQVDRMDRFPSFQAQRSFEAGGWRFLLLNTQMPGETYGRLSQNDLQWLQGELTTHPDQPTLLALHHPPVSVGTPWLDRICLRRPDALGDLVAAHEQVRLLLCGHIHQAYEDTWRGVPLLATPSTCFQFKPHTQNFALDHDADPGGRRLWLHDDGTFETRIERAATHYALDGDADGY